MLRIVYYKEHWAITVLDYTLYQCIFFFGFLQEMQNWHFIFTTAEQQTLASI